MEGGSHDRIIRAPTRLADGIVGPSSRPMLQLYFATSAIVPSVLLVWYFRARDLNPEPARTLWWTFLLGVVTVVPVLIYCSPVSPAIASWGEPLARGWLSAFVLAGIPEEFFKFVVVRGYAARHRDFDEPMDGIVYGAVASLGFATLENVLYVSRGGFGVAIMRALSAVPMHAATGAIMGYYVARARFGIEPAGRTTAKAYFIPMLLHAIYDGPLLARELGHGTLASPFASPFISLLVLFFEIVWVRRLVRRLRADQIEARRRTAAAVVIDAAGAPLAAIAERSTEIAVQAGSHKYAAPSRVGTVLLLVFGALFASVGGLLLLAVLVAAATGHVGSGRALDALFGGLVLGGPPLALGLFLFARGLRRR
jgi:RsiW-degrading membrane proteinase PrsW (M82 family)